MSKAILITGSSRGIGKATAELAHKQGWKVIVHGRTETDKLKELHKDLKGSFMTHFDISDKKATEEALDKLLEEVGQIDVLVNNAEVAKNFLNDLSGLDNQKATEEFNVNILGTLNCTQKLLPSMLKSDGCAVVNIASIKGHYNLSTLSTLTFGATKAGIIAMTKALAKAYPPVRFNSISPGYVETDQVKDWNDQTFDRINNGTVLGRIAEPSEIAKTIMFVASDAASYMTGSDILCDGGYSVKGK